MLLKCTYEQTFNLNPITKRFLLFDVLIPSHFLVEYCELFGFKSALIDLTDLFVFLSRDLNLLFNYSNGVSLSLFLQKLNGIQHQTQISTRKCLPYKITSWKTPSSVLIMWEKHPNKHWGQRWTIHQLARSARDDKSEWAVNWLSLDLL